MFRKPKKTINSDNVTEEQCKKLYEYYKNIKPDNMSNIFHKFFGISDANRKEFFFKNNSNCVPHIPEMNSYLNKVNDKGTKIRNKVQSDTVVNDEVVDNNAVVTDGNGTDGNGTDGNGTVVNDAVVNDTVVGGKKRKSRTKKQKKPKKIKTKKNKTKKIQKT